MSGEWQPIETAPKDGTRILSFSEEHGVQIVNWGMYGARWWEQWGEEPMAPTHWQPLPPEPPKS